MNTSAHKPTFDTTQSYITIESFDTARRRERLYTAIVAAQRAAKVAGNPVVLYYRRLAIIIYPSGAATGRVAG